MPSSASLAARTFTGTFLDPASALAWAVARRSSWPALAAGTLAALLLAAALVPRLDVAPAVEARLDADPEAAQLSPHDREQRFEQARKLAVVTSFAGALTGPAARALLLAAALALAFRLAGARPAYPACLAVAAWALLPLALRDLATLPALLRSSTLAPEALDGLLPSTAAALLPQGSSWPAPLRHLLAGLDLFAGWSAALVALGMAEAGGVSRRRAFAVVALLWLSWLALAHVALPGFTAPPPGAP